MNAPTTAIHFSGTGNSYRAARWFADRATGPVDVIPMSEIDPATFVPPGPGGIVALFFPVHFFTAPAAVILFALSLPPGRGGGTVVVATRGALRRRGRILSGWEGTAAWLIALILRLKGYPLRGVTGIDMPSNFTLIHPPCDAETAAAILDRGRTQLEAFARPIVDGRSKRTGLLRGALGLFAAPVSIFFLLFGRYWLAKTFFASARCGGCALCRDRCPTASVAIDPDDGIPFWRHTCAVCLRCLAFCPKHAIESGYGIGLLTAAVILLPVPSYILTGVAMAFPAASGAPGPAALLTVGYLWGVAAIFLVYRSLHRLMRRPGLRYLLFLFSATRRLGRYREPTVVVEDLGGCRKPEGG